jgi:glycosyltransferase involved in cell wall biosynthesis
MTRAVREFRPDVLHVQCFSSNGVFATIAGRRSSVPVIVSLQGETVMDDNDIYERSMLLRGALRHGLRRAAAITACSQFVLDDAVARFGLPTTDGVVVANGVDLDESADPEQLDIPYSRFVFAVGRIVEKKGFDLLIDAFARLANAHPDLGLVIGGDGRARDSLTKKVQALGIADRVALPGALSRSQVAWAMQAADAFVLPSRLEPFGIVVLEALRSGTPAIVSNRGGARQIVGDGRYGLTVDPFDASALAGAIDSLLRDPQRAQELGAAGKRRAQSFSWDVITDQYQAIYERVTRA